MEGVFVGIATHTARWLGNLKRAKRGRKEESKRAVAKALAAVQETRVYLRQRQETEKRSYHTESRLAGSWTELGYELERIGLTKFGKRCQIKGRYWADPNSLSKQFLNQADIRLERIEREALTILHELNH